MPFENLVAMDLTGAEIRELLDRHFRDAASPYRLEWSGLVADVEGASGAYTVVAIDVGGKPLDARGRTASPRTPSSRRAATASTLSGAGRTSSARASSSATRSRRTCSTAPR